MNRRDFSAHVVSAPAAAAGLGLAALAARAQGPSAAQRAAPVEGKHFVRLNPPLPAPPAGKIEVIEFFWYGCPHCNAFEPALDAWQKRLPADVNFKRLPIAFANEPFVAHQRIFFALESLGKLEPMHRKVFYAIHTERNRLDKTEDILAFMTKNGLEGPKFLDAYNSFDTQAKARRAAKLGEAYKIDGVPAIGVQGRFYTSGSLAGTADASLPVADFLIAQVRRGA